MWSDPDTTLACLIAFRTWVTWLHGDDRRLIDRFHNRYEPSYIEPSPMEPSLSESYAHLFRFTKCLFVKRVRPSQAAEALSRNDTFVREHEDLALLNSVIVGLNMHFK